MNEASERIETVEPAGESQVSATPSDGDAAAANGEGAVTGDEVREALKAVLDPELGINIVDLGLVYDVDIADGHVHVTYTLTTMGCPIGPLIEAQMHQLLDPLPGIDSFDAELVLRPPWSPEMMSEEAKEALGYF
ncbi:MAG TPA: metal-sulfur cluster assembly factor [Actinomycetota bacterium]|jgi:metal-sulfur cluster biosynthetic enzyme